MADMLKAIRLDDVRKVQKKLLKGFDVNKAITETNNGKEVHTIPLCLAATRGNRDIVELLMTYGANIHASNYDWSTPMHMATYYGFLEIIRCILKRKVNMNNSDQQGNTVLHLAALKNNYEATLLYLEHNVDTEIRNNKGQTAMEIARSLNYEHIIDAIADKKKMTKEQAADQDEKRVQAKQLMAEITQKERLQRQLQDLEIQEINASLKEKEETVFQVSTELEQLNQEANSLASQIAQLEAKLREVNQSRVSKERIKSNMLEEIEELKNRKSLHFEASVTRSRSLKDTYGSGEPSSQERDEYECPICFELPTSPRKVYQCANGHVYCSDCKEKPKMTNCPQCRIPLDVKSPIRNIVYEEMIASKPVKRRQTAS